MGGKALVKATLDYKPLAFKSPKYMCFTEFSHLISWKVQAMYIATGCQQFKHLFYKASHILVMSHITF